jgi:hypothetical protein
LGLKNDGGGNLADYLLHVNQALDLYPDPPGGSKQAIFKTVARLAVSVPQSWVDYVRQHNIDVGNVQVCMCPDVHVSGCACVRVCMCPSWLRAECAEKDCTIAP